MCKSLKSIPLSAHWITNHFFFSLSLWCKFGRHQRKKKSPICQIVQRIERTISIPVDCHLSLKLLCNRHTLLMLFGSVPFRTMRANSILTLMRFDRLSRPYFKNYFSLAYRCLLFLSFKKKMEIRTFPQAKAADFPDNHHTSHIASKRSLCLCGCTMPCGCNSSTPLSRKRCVQMQCAAAQRQKCSKQFAQFHPFPYILIWRQCTHTATKLFGCRTLHLDINNHAAHSVFILSKFAYGMCLISYFAIRCAGKTITKTIVMSTLMCVLCNRMGAQASLSAQWLPAEKLGEKSIQWYTFASGWEMEFHRNPFISHRFRINPTFESDPRIDGEHEMALLVAACARDIRDLTAPTRCN